MLPLGSSVRVQNAEYFTRELLLASPGFTVVRADNRLLGRSEALKVSHAPTRQILQDAQQIATLSHPCNVRVLNAGIVDIGEPRPVVVMPFVGGEPLDALLEREGRLSPMRACRLLGQALSALDEAHRAGLVYGSLTPFTVRYSERVVEQLHFADYGLSTPSKDNHQTSPAHLLSADPVYTAPERFLGSAPTPQGDLFSLGVIFYELLTGHKPFPQKGFGLLQAYQRDFKPAPLSKRAELPQTLEKLILHLIAVDPDLRISSAADAAARLLTLDPDELLAFSSSPLQERNALSGDLNLPPRFHHPGSATIEEDPVVWALTEDPAFRLPDSTRFLDVLEERFAVKRLDSAGARRALEQLQAGACAPPWVVLFGDLHVILGEPLLEELGKRGDLSRVLVSTHLNADMIHSTVNLCSLDQQLLADAPLPERIEAVAAMVERTRAILSVRAVARAPRRDAPETAPRPEPSRTPRRRTTSNSPARSI